MKLVAMHGRLSGYQPRSCLLLMLCGVAALLLTAAATAAPVIQNVIGGVDQKGSITITGSGFGRKAKAAALAYDGASGSNIQQLWDGTWPNEVGEYNTAHDTRMRNIDLPHCQDTSYIAGAHVTNKAYLLWLRRDALQNGRDPTPLMCMQAGTSVLTMPGTSATIVDASVRAQLASSVLAGSTATAPNPPSYVDVH